MRFNILVLATLIAIGSPALAAADDAAQKKDPVLIYRNAGVNPDQEAKIRQLAQEYDKAGRVRVERLHKLSQQMREMSYDAELDESKLLSIQNELNDVQSAINTERTKLMLKIRGLLTAEQKAKLVELMREKDGLPPLKAVEKPVEKPVGDSAQVPTTSGNTASNPAPSPNPNP